MPVRTFSLRLLPLLRPAAALMCFVLGLGASSAALASSKAEATRSAQPKTSAEKQGIEARFSAFPMRDLNAQQQAQFTRVAEGELCPCPHATDSLAACFEDANARCDLAREAGRILFRGVQRRQSDPALSKAIADGLKQVQTSHTFALENLPYQGAETPKVTLVVFADFECPYCKRMAQITDRLLEQFPDTLRVYFLHYPLPSHGNATDAAIAAHAAHQQGKFWPYHDRIFQEQQTLSRSMDAIPLLRTWAQELGLDLKQFQKDMENPDTYAAVRAQQQQGQDAGIRGTPSVFINGKAFSDIQSEGAIRAHIQSLIKEHRP